MSTAGVSGLLWKARTLAVRPCADAGAAKARTRAAARMAPTRTRSLATTYDLLQRGAGHDPYFGPARRPVAGDRELRAIPGRSGPAWPGRWGRSRAGRRHGGGG